MILFQVALLILMGHSELNKLKRIYLEQKVSRTNSRRNDRIDREKVLQSSYTLRMIRKFIELKRQIRIHRIPIRKRPGNFLISHGALRWLAMLRR